MKRIFSLLFFTLFALSFNAGAQYRKINTITGIGGVGGYGGDGFAAPGGAFNSPQAVDVDRWGNVYIVDYYNYRVRKIKTNGILVTLAGNGLFGYTGDSTDATTAKVCPRGVAADFRGNVYISDAIHHVIRKVNTIGIISTYAGTGASGYYGDNGPAKLAKLNTPFGLACDKKGNLFIADAGNHVIRKIDTFGQITTVAGDGTPGLPVDGIPAISSQLDSPYAVALDRYGNLFIADHQNNVVRKVDLVGDIYTYAGTGVIGNTGNGALAVAATLNYPTGVAVDTTGNLYISDAYNNVIRMVDTNHIITLSVGNGFAGFGGDLGDPLGANLYHPYSVAVDTIGSLFIADVNNQRVRKVYNASLGVNDVTSNSDIEAYPNPMGSTITVSALNSGDKVCLYDMVGKAVSETHTVTKAGIFSFNINDVAPGIYLLQVVDAQGNRRTAIKMTK